MGTMFDPVLLLVLLAFHVVALLGINLGLVRFMRRRLSRHAVSWRCNKYANHVAYVLTVGDAVIRWTYIYPKRPSDNSSSPGRARC